MGQDQSKREEETRKPESNLFVNEDVVCRGRRSISRGGG